jgi:gamma-glutamyltranspeptidase / glutathione hydrolase
MSPAKKSGRKSRECRKKILSCATEFSNQVKRMMKGAVAAGHSETAEAAADVLREGGNAYDAVVTAHLTACVAEPVLTSLAGGGFLMAKTGNGTERLYDFFVQTPLKQNPKSHFFPISADFGTVQQEFHIGPGSMAVPGTVKGLYAIHEDLCTLPMKRLAEPAIQLARKGLKMNALQARIMDVVKPIYLEYPEATEIFGGPGKRDQLVQEGDILKQPHLADFMEEMIHEGVSFFYNGDFAMETARICREQGGHLSADDFQHYQVIRRKPISLVYRDCRLSINPPPSSGGILVSFALKLLEDMQMNNPEFGSAGYAELMAEIQGLTEKAKADAFADDGVYDNILDPGYLRQYKKMIKDKFPAFKGTTHISIADSEGNMAALTTSNGEGCGIMIPGTGVMMNNMLGEEDINPRGFEQWPLNERLTSMMAPGILKMKDRRTIAFGSGGSNRIRTAVLQLLVNLIDFGMAPDEAVTSPRIHFEKELLNIEYGYEKKTVDQLTKRFPDHKIWQRRDLFFGGTHVAGYGPEGYFGFGDPRRGGVVVVVE